MNFESLGLSPVLLRALDARGYEAPTPVQVAAIPAVLSGRDVLVSAQTGSGKTAAYLLPILDTLGNGRAHAEGRRLHALIVVPTRELVTQVVDVARQLAEGMPRPLKVVGAAGGVSINPQLMALRGGADVVVATPGRLLDLVEHNGLSLGRLPVLVLDEADRLLDEGFDAELVKVLAMTPLNRQTLLFSATFAPEVRSLTQRVLNDPVEVDIAPTEGEGADGELTVSESVQQEAIVVDATRRTALLHHLIKTRGWQQLLVFVSTRHGSELVAAKLRRLKWPAQALHGWLSQGARSSVLQAFSEGRQQVLVATDMASRGLDIPNLPVVVNYDLPRSAVDHIHRVGRTGRAGASGLAVNFVTPEAESHFRLIEKRQQKRLERVMVAGFEPTEPVPAPAQTPGTGGIKGRRKSKKDKLREAAARNA